MDAPPPSSAPMRFSSTSCVEFLGYARQVIEQTDFLERRYLSKKPPRRVLSVSSQHYAFAVNAFVSMVRKTNADEYELTMRETRTHDIVESVRTLRSEIGIFYLNPFNRKVIKKLLRESDLTYHSLFAAKPYIFTGSASSLAKFFWASSGTTASFWSGPTTRPGP